MKDDKINGASARPEEPQDDFEVRERKRWTFFGLPFTFTTYTLTPKKLTVQTGLFTTAEEMCIRDSSWAASMAKFKAVLAFSVNPLNRYIYLLHF